MREFFDAYLGPMQQFGAAWIALGVISLIVTVITLPIVILQLPADYFVSEDRVAASRSRRHPVVAITLMTIKNMAGIVLVFVGAIMLFVPGQGILTMLIGLMLTNFPGKYHLEQKLVRRPAVLRALNRVRAFWNRSALLPPEPAVD